MVWMEGLAAVGAGKLFGKRKHRTRAAAQSVMDANRDIVRTSVGGGGDFQSIINDLLQGYQGDFGQLQQALQTFGPNIATSLMRSPAFQFLQNPENWDSSMGTYGMGAGMIGQAGQRNQAAGAEGLARMGLGRSGAMATLGQRSASDVATQQANLFSQLREQSVQNRLAGAERATNAEQNIARMALSLTPAPRVQPEKGDNGLGGIIGQGLGTAIGMLPFAI